MCGGACVETVQAQQTSVQALAEEAISDLYLPKLIVLHTLDPEQTNVAALKAALLKYAGDR